MRRLNSASTSSHPAALLSRLTLIAALIALFTTVFNSRRLLAVNPAGAEFSATARRYSAASRYRDETDDYRSSAAVWSRAAFH